MAEQSISTESFSRLAFVRGFMSLRGAISIDVQTEHTNHPSFERRQLRLSDLESVFETYDIGIRQAAWFESPVHVGYLGMSILDLERPIEHALAEMAGFINDIYDSETEDDALNALESYLAADPPIGELFVRSIPSVPSQAQSAD